ncbi:3-deoxy-D-manno-octulosonic acid transferase [Caenimonas koreensis DSM 17982]|uniref:3-deoxy-D-manno-octulosonic acid transferase n=1 Tax=Caenimonas koreensis DSM 17982 TaxID=1121255 RepID=A0A844AZH0_9BURK|nr:3-deoxy-D-manno-octulosonic acid transferase [Caenimonas koreensis]MRD46452.1 3-deoxy-D-manno-octulosonic acid transferase [Caenimonas koreensis DSM 17982]
MTRSLVLSAYSALAVAVQPFLRSKLRRRGRVEPGYLQHMGERFGAYEQPAQAGALWIHAVSLGETRAAGILIEHLRSLQPDIRILLTHGTATGRAEGERWVRAGDAQAWLPWDTPQAVRRFFNHFKPSAGVLMETEVWPNLVAAARDAGVALALANARLSAKSLAGTLRLSSLSRPAYAALAAVWAQTDADAKRLAQAGATVKGVFGNLKFDATPDASLLQRGRLWREMTARPVVMFASSREGEEAELIRVLQAHPQWVKGAQAVQWLIVPRHPQRFDEVASLIGQAGLTMSRRSAWASQPAVADVWLGDSLGEMAFYFGMSRCALLGGSFEKLGGQNLIEAAACGCPVVMGPHTFNFTEAAQLSQQAGAAFRVASLQEGMGEAVRLVSDVPAQQRSASAALAFAAANQGAALKTAQAVLALMRR